MSEVDGELFLLEAAHRLASELPDESVAAIRRAVADCVHHGWSWRRIALTQAANHPRARDLAGQLVDAWSAHASTVTPAALDLVLRTATLEVARRRTGPSLDLVWTGPATREIELRQTSQALLDVIRAARTHLTIVSFAVTRIPTIEAELRRVAGRLRSVRLVAESPDKSDGQLSSSAAHHLQQATGGRVQLFHWPRERRPVSQAGRPAVLHAKCAVADDDLLFVSSANLTDAAMTANMELGMLVRGGDAPGKVRRHIDALIAEGHLEPEMNHREAH